jgi:hypothetical protein
MVKLKIKGREFDAISIKDSHLRKAILYQNKIIESLGRIGLTADDIDIKLETVPIKRVPASASWYFEGNHLYYSYSAAKNFADNLVVVFNVINIMTSDLLDGVITADQYFAEFKEDEDIVEKRKQARELIGVPHDSFDLELINKKYKNLAKEHHPDKDGGDIDKFKELNHAHKLLKRELE